MEGGGGGTRAAESYALRNFSYCQPGVYQSVHVFIIQYGSLLLELRKCCQKAFQDTIQC